MNSSISSFKAKGYVLLTLGVAAGALLLLLALSELLLRFWAVPRDNFYKHLALYESLQDASVAGFGDSHMSQGFYPGQPDMVNLAYPGESFEQIAKKIEYALQNKQIDNIILQISPHMFADYRFDDSSRNYDVFFGPDAAWKSQLRLQDPNLRKQLLDLWTVFFVSLGQYPDSARLMDNGTMVIDQTMTYPPTEKEIKYRVTRLEEHRLEAGYKDKHTWQAMRRTIRDIKERGVGLCLVTFPVTAFYYEPALEMDYTQDAIGRLKALAAEEGVPYFFHWPLYGTQYELFRDLDHLNREGAVRFTRKLLNECGFASY